MSNALCEGCGEHSFLLPLHGGKGGPLRCPLCVGAWNAEHGRKRRCQNSVWVPSVFVVDPNLVRQCCRRSRNGP
jgi:hypothetical protein